MEVYYSNAQRITHGKGEFYIDFYQLSGDRPNIQSTEPTARIYMNPETVMSFREALEKNVQKFMDVYLKPGAKDSTQK